MTRFAPLVTAVSFLYALGWAGASYAEEATFTPDPPAVVPPEGMVPENLVLVEPLSTAPKYIFIADKKVRTLTVWERDKGSLHLYGAYPMDIGKYQGDKTNTGDHRTPEGIYFFQQKKEGSELDFSLYGKKAFTLDYPNIFDTKAGKTGYGIWLHAVPDTVSLLRGSRGCVVVRNKTIELLSNLITLRSTPLLILDQVRYVAASELKGKQEKLVKWLDGWRSSWQGRNIENYMNYYSHEFRAMNMNKKNWRKYKTALSEKYSFIKVGVRSPLAISRNDQTIISFIQDYESDGLKDSGEKVLYLKVPSGDKPEIITEEWKPLQQELLARKQAAENY